MLKPCNLLLYLVLPLLAAALPAPDLQVPLTPVKLQNETNIRPLVLWHGLGDSHSSPGMLQFAELIKGVHPDIFVHSIYIEKNLDADQRAGFFGNVNLQLEGVAARLAGIKELQNGFDAIGFSQAGQFLRAYVERYNDPPVNNLITFGAQHMGIADLPACRPGDFLCQAARRVARTGVYNTWAQRNLVQAQYFRDPDQLPAYYEYSEFLLDINNEILDSINTTYAKNLASLANLVLVLFADDKTVIPKESAWFGSYAPAEEETEGHKSIVPMQLQPIYLADTIGLRTLDERGGVRLQVCEGEHMQIGKGCWEPLVRDYVGGNLDDDADDYNWC